MRKITLILPGLILLLLAPCGFGADISYKEIIIFTNADAVRVRLPLTDVTGKVRLKEKSAEGFGTPVAPTRTKLGPNDYLEWQIGYDSPDTNSPSFVPAITFARDGQTKYGHELSKIIFEAVQTGVISTDDLAGEIRSLKEIPPDKFQVNQPVKTQVMTNAELDGFQLTIQRLPEYIKTTPHGWVSVQLKQKQHAVGYQAMIYVCLPMNEVLAMDGLQRETGPAKSKETVYYDFNRANAAFLLDIIHAFGIASQEHNDDMREILGKILETAH